MPDINSLGVPRLMTKESLGVEPLMMQEYEKRIVDVGKYEKEDLDMLSMFHDKILNEMDENKVDEIVKLDIIQEIGKKLITDIELLKVPCETVEDLKEGEDIASKLFRMLSFINKHKIMSGSGLSANQIGINKRVCVINIKDPIYLINPTIVDADGECNYYEGCLSFPGVGVKTKRYTTFTVKADNLESELFFDISHLTSGADYWMNPDVFEAMCVQHEIDHLNGITMFDRKLKPISAEIVPGRNEKVLISNGTEKVYIKYKNFHTYRDRGYSII